MTILSQGVYVALETSYGTAPASASAYRLLPVTGESFTRDVEFLEDGGRWPGQQARLSNRRVTISRGASGRLDMTLAYSQMGRVLRDLLGAAAGPTSKAGAPAGDYTLTLTSTPRGPAGSLTILVTRADTNAQTLHWFQYSGCVATGWELAVEEGGLVTLGIDYDCRAETVLNAAPSGTFGTIGVQKLADYEDVAVSVGGSAAACVRGFTFTADLALKTDRFFLDGSGLKRQPRRQGLPSFTGSLDCEFRDIGQFNDFINGARKSLAVTITSPSNISTSVTVPETVTLTCPAIMFDGSTPTASLDSLTMIDQPFMVLDDPSSSTAVVTLTTVSADSAL